MKLPKSSILAGAALALAANAPAAPLTAGHPIPLAGTHGGFDFIRIDTHGRRLLLGHTGNDSMDVFDIDSRALLKSVPTGKAQDVAVDGSGSAYYASCNDPAHLAIVDAKTLGITGSVDLPGPVDLVAFDPVRGLVRDCHDDGSEEWIIDPAGPKLVGNLEFDGEGPEDLAFSPDGSRLYQAVKGNGTIVVIDPAKNTIVATWALAPAKGPHGLAVLPDGSRLLVACAGKLVMVDTASGKVVATADIAERVDEIAYDPGLHRAYGASRTGVISVVDVTPDSLSAVGDVPDAPGTGSVVVDPATHIVWVASHTGDAAFVQPFTPSK